MNFYVIFCGFFDTVKSRIAESYLPSENDIITTEENNDIFTTVIK